MHINTLKALTKETRNFTNLFAHKRLCSLHLFITHHYASLKSLSIFRIFGLISYLFIKKSTWEIIRVGGENEIQNFLERDLAII